jgi:ABC-type multidrug transport system fused ATPase/permease subunit
MLPARTLCTALMKTPSLSSLLLLLPGAYGIGSVTLDTQAQITGQQAAARLFAIRDAPLTVDPFSESGAMPAVLAGAISFSNVLFAYLSRPQHPVYGGSGSKSEGFCLEIKAGDTVALVSEQCHCC